MGVDKNLHWMIFTEAGIECGHSKKKLHCPWHVQSLWCALKVEK